MAYFVICGKNDCTNFVHAIHVAEHLSKNLPHFIFRSIVKSESEWPLWLDQINSLNNWYHTKSPLVWKEVNRMGSKAYLIGGLGEFWEYCYDYYGFRSKMPTEDLLKILADNQWTAPARSEFQIYNIGIIGASCHLTLQLLIYELQDCFESKGSSTMEIKLYDQRFNDDPEEQEFLLDIVDGFKDILKCRPQSVSVATDFPNLIENCDLLIIIDDFRRLRNEDVDDWLDRCRTSMVILADDINVYAKRSLKVVLNHFGPVCFNASVLMEYCTTIRLANIVAVTADEGISVISMMAEKVGELVENFWCPPVWGFSGIMSYVNVASTAITTGVYRPYKRALLTKESSNLPKGEIQYEIRFLGSLIKTEDPLYAEIENRQADEIKILQRPPILPKIRAIGSLLKLWFAEEISDDIISLGVCSNGAFGFAPGVCFSQAVFLNEKRIWEPISYLPLYPETSARIQAVALHVENTLRKFDLGDKSWRSIV